LPCTHLQKDPDRSADEDAGWGNPIPDKQAKNRTFSNQLICIKKVKVFLRGKLLCESQVPGGKISTIKPFSES
jgi:hypothetical protein